MARMKVNPHGDIATFTVTRSDGQELSLSSDRNSLIRWSDGGDCLEDYGSFTSVEKFREVLDEFLAGED